MGPLAGGDGGTAPGAELRKVEGSLGAGRVCAHLVLLLEAIALGTLHLCDVLEQVGHPDGGVQLSGLVGHVGRLTLLVRVWLHQAAGVAGHRVRLIWEKKVMGKVRGIRGYAGVSENLISP